MATKNKVKDRVLSEKVKDILRLDIELREKLAEQIGVKEMTIYRYATQPKRERSLTKYPIVIDVLKKHTGLLASEILIDK
jgi:hypothetical protein